MMSPPPRYVDDKAANMMFASQMANMRSLSLRSPVQPTGPPVPPKEDKYQPVPMRDWDRRKNGKGIGAKTEWDVEKGITEENDRRPLDLRRDYHSRW